MECKFCLTLAQNPVTVIPCAHTYCKTCSSGYASMCHCCGPSVGNIESYWRHWIGLPKWSSERVYKTLLISGGVHEGSLGINRWDGLKIALMWELICYLKSHKYMNCKVYLVKIKFD